MWGFLLFYVVEKNSSSFSYNNVGLFALVILVWFHLVFFINFGEVGLLDSEIIGSFNFILGDASGMMFTLGDVLLSTLGVEMIAL